MAQRTRTRDLLYDTLPPNPFPGYYPPAPPYQNDDEVNDNTTGTKGKLIFNNIKDFPETGRYDILYFNRDNNTLYCWDGEDNRYVPISATLTEGASIDGGGAADG